MREPTGTTALTGSTTPAGRTALTGVRTAIHRVDRATPPNGTVPWTPCAPSRSWVWSWATGW